eukprot:scaffold4060_cov101-Skeletonema_dohrnii-CCMP3373.AAC.7
MLAVISDASSGHLRRCSDTDTTNQCLSQEKDASILPWPSLLEMLAVISELHQVTYDVVTTLLRPTNA